MEVNYPGPLLDKGTQILDKMLLNQYTNKPHLREYLLAYISEMDELFSEIHEVYWNRFLDLAVGRQLDIVGIILNQNRRVSLPETNFGFAGAVGSIAGFADEATPADGGVFLGGGEVLEIVPLTDNQYRRLLRAKASCLNSEENSINTTYKVIQILLGKAPSTLRLEVTASREVTLHLSSTEVTVSDASLIAYASKFFVPVGTAFSVSLA